MPGDSNFTGSEMVGFIFSKLNWTGFILEWSSLKVDLLLTAQSSLFSTRPWCSASVHPVSNKLDWYKGLCHENVQQQPELLMQARMDPCFHVQVWPRLAHLQSSIIQLYKLVWVVAPVSCSGMTVSCYCSNLLQDSTCSFTDALLQNLVVTSGYSM